MCNTNQVVEIVRVYPRFRVEKHEDGYHAVSLRNGVVPLFGARAIGPCVSIKQAEYLASHGKTML